MTSEIRTNTLKNRVGLGTISLTNTGAIVSGIVTATSFEGGLPITNGADNRIVTCTSASAIRGETGLTYNGSTFSAAAHTFNFTQSGNVVTDMHATGGDAKLILDNSGNNNYSGIDFTRERSTGTGVVGGSIFMKSDTSTNDAYLYLQAQSASAQSPVTTALSDNNGVRLLLRGGDGIFSVEAGSTEKLRINSDGKIKFATSNSTTDYFEWGANPRLYLKVPSGTNGLRIDSDTTPLEIRNSSANGRSLSFGSGGATNFDIVLSGDYSLSSSGYDSTPKMFFNTTRHNGSTTVTSFQCSIQGVATSNTNNTGYLGLAASATPDDLVILTSGDVGINNIAPTAKLDIVEATSIPAVKIKSGTSTNQNASLTFSNDNGGGLMHLGVFGSSASTYGSNEATDGFISAMQQLSINSQNASGEIRFGVGVPPETKLRITSTGHVRQIWGDGLFFGAYYSSEYYMGFTYGANARELYIDNRTNDTRADIVFRTKEGGAPEERLRITSIGKVGIGTNNPGSLLHITAGNDRSAIRLENTYDTPDNVWELIPGISGVSNTGFCIRDVTDSANRLVINGSGKVGIGTDNPRTGYLHVGPISPQPGSAFSAPLTTYATGDLGGNVGNDNKIATFAGRASGNVSGLSLYHFRERNGTNYTTDGFSFRQEVDNTENVYEYMNFTRGKIGIGTMSPSKQVHIEGTIPFLRLEDATVSSKRLDLFVENSDGYIGANQSAQKLHFQTTTETRMTIDAVGKVIIGMGGQTNNQGQVVIKNSNTFNSASVSNNTDNIYLISDATSGDGVYGASIGFSRVGYADRRAAAIVSVQEGTDEDQVGLAFFTHPSTNPTASVVEKFRINADGKIGVNNTNPSARVDFAYDSGTNNNAFMQFKGPNNKSGEMLHKYIHNGGAASSKVVNLLEITSWQSSNSRIFGVVKVMTVNPLSNQGNQHEGWFFKADDGSADTGTMVMVHNKGGSVGSLDWDGDTLRYNTPATGYLNMHVSVEYHIYDGGTVVFDTDSKSF
tara:strand:+ start:1297 stop:4329 length:3033 start_codon:yes stop_codon:yes gene_type:complete